MVRIARLRQAEHRRRDALRREPEVDALQADETLDEEGRSGEQDVARASWPDDEQAPGNALMPGAAATRTVLQAR